MNWTLRVGPVVHRESIPLSQVRQLRAIPPGAGGARQRDAIVRLSADAALFAVPSAYEHAVVTKGDVVIKGGNAEIAYRASVGAIVFLALWFGLLIAFEIGILFLPSPRPLTLAVLVAGLMAGSALLVRRATRAEIRVLRGFAAEAAIRLASLHHPTMNS